MNHPAHSRALRMLLRHSTWLLIAAMGCCQAGAAAAEIPSTFPAVNSSSGYCGLYCLYAASQSIGAPIAFEQLLKSAYISSDSGSSLADLDLAAKDHGLSTLAFTNGTLAMLRSSTVPIILHIKQRVETSESSHFVMLLGNAGTDFTVMDPGDNPYRSISGAELLSMWDRSGIVISRTKVNASTVFGMSWLAILAELSAMPALLILFRRKLNRLFKSVSGEAAFLASCAVLIAASVNCFATDGFIRNPQIIEEVEQAHLASFLPKIELSQLTTKAREGAILIDARFSRDFAAGHLPNAINIPIDSDPQFRERRLADIPFQTPLIIYCQSKDCPFAQRIALSLRNHGRMNLMLVDGGYEEWCELQRNQNG